MCVTRINMTMSNAFQRNNFLKLNVHTIGVYYIYALNLIIYVHVLNIHSRWFFFLRNVETLQQIYEHNEFSCDC